MMAGPLCPSRPQSPVTAVASPGEGTGTRDSSHPCRQCSALPLAAAANTRDRLRSLPAQRAPAGLPPYRPHPKHREARTSP